VTRPLFSIATKRWSFAPERVPESIAPFFCYVHNFGVGLQISSDVHFTVPGGLADLFNRGYFISSENGWMTQPDFLLYAHFLIYKLQTDRARMPAHLGNERFLLILDGHTSRWTFEATCMLRNAGIDFWSSLLTAHTCCGLFTSQLQLR
jgi:hypothetical protein